MLIKSGDKKMTNDLLIESINSFGINANKISVKSSSSLRHTSPHIHDCCEIYINISGNVSFMVENSIYSIMPGDIIITKPYEYHHCIYNDESDHNHYWLMFSPYENSGLFHFIMSKKRGENNLIRLPSRISKKIMASCDKIIKAPSVSTMTSLSAFFDILSYIEQGLINYTQPNNNSHIPKELNEIITYVNKNFASITSINKLVETFHTSHSTLERMFKKHLDMTPRQYLYDKKFSNACRMLRNNASVTEACFQSGFDDYSNFIQNFKKIYKTTPLKYKKVYWSGNVE